MSNTNGKLKDVEGLILEALKKTGVRRENDLCRFLPGPSGGYIHHFTLRKMKSEAPSRLNEMIQQYILEPEKPKRLPHKQRAPRGSRKRLELLNFSRQDMDRLLSMVRQSGDKEMIRKLTPRRDLRTVKRELISSIRHGRIDPELWNAYVEQVTSQNAYSATLPTDPSQKLKEALGSSLAAMKV